MTDYVIAIPFAMTIVNAALAALIQLGRHDLPGRLYGALSPLWPVGVFLLV